MAQRKGGKQSPKNPASAKQKGLDSGRGSSRGTKKGSTASTTRKGTQKVVPPQNSAEAFE